jgi:hypothetical protein
MEQLQRVIDVRKDERDRQDVPDVIRFPFQVLAQLGDHAFRAFEPRLDLGNVDVHAVAAVEDQASFGPVKDQRFPQPVKERRKL